MQATLRPDDRDTLEDGSGKLRELVGSGDKIALATLPAVVIGLTLDALYPSAFSVGGPPRLVQWLCALTLAVGLVNWAWCVALLLIHVPRHELITTGPYAWAKHPLYTGVALLVLPALGIVLDSWVGVPIGAALYFASRRFSPQEERVLAQTFGAAWNAYIQRVRLPWL
ncbi:MAG TPA: isoprenylcysteine carboxylmethyltransferase family protein [Polyangiaceae bacterium]|nr:isoprenylcysteine carboxylmethyltransferase family protein [Polyangiaceae bacterium]